MKVTYNMACHRSYKHLLRQWIRTDNIYCTRLQPLLEYQHCLSFEKSCQPRLHVLQDLVFRITVNLNFSLL